jgi:hypothetical protein
MDQRRSGGQTAGVVAVVAGLTPARADSRGIHNRGPRVRSIIGDSITLARPVVEASKRSNDDSDNVQLSNACPEPGTTPYA